MLKFLPKIGAKKIENLLASRVFQIDLSMLILNLMIAVYTILFSYFTTLKHQRFLSYAWDLGIFNQAFWTTLKFGKFFYYTTEIFMNPTGSFFGIHFSPILFLILPVYSIYPHPETLLVIQSFILALGALPLYKLSMLVLKSRIISLFFVFIYLIYPPLHGVNWFDFHMQAFLPLFFLSSIYFLEKKDTKLFFLFVVLSLACEEHVAFIVMFMGFLVALQHRSQLINLLKTRNFKDPLFLTSILTILLAIFWYFMTVLVRGKFFPINPSFLSSFKALPNWSVLGISDPLLIPIYIFLYPQRAMMALQHDFLLKIGYVIALFGPLFFSSFYKSKHLLPTVPWFVYSFFSNYPPYYSIYTQYSAYVIAFVFISALHSINGINFNRTKIRRLAIILLFSLVAFSVASPIGPIANIFYDSGIRQLTQHEQNLHKILFYVPNDASIITQNNIFPHISSRLEAYAIPIEQIWITNPVECRKFVMKTLEKVDYALVDIKTDLFAAKEILNLLKERSDFKVLASADGAILFKKNYESTPSIIAPYTIIYTSSNLTLYAGKIVTDAGSKNVNVLYYNGSLGESPLFWYSTRYILPPGSYAINFGMKINGSGKLFIIELCSDNGQNILKSVAFSDTNIIPNVWVNYVFYLDSKRPLLDFEIRAVNLSKNANVYLDYIIIKQLG